MTNSSAPPTPPIQAPHVLGYSSPSGAADAPIWSNGKQVVTLDRAVFPARCLKCNGGDNLKTIVKKLVWSPPLLYLLLLFPGILIGGLILILTQRKAKITIAICQSCLKKRRKHILIAWLIFFASVGAFVLAGYLESALLAILGVVLFLTCLIYIFVATSLCAAAKIRDKVVTIKGAGPDFLRSLDLRQ